MPCPQPLGAGACVPQPWPPPLPEGDPRGQGPSRPGPTGRQNFCPERSLRATGVSASQVTQLGEKKLSRTPELVDPNLRSAVPTGEDRAGFACESLGTHRGLVSPSSLPSAPLPSRVSPPRPTSEGGAPPPRHPLPASCVLQAEAFALVAPRPDTGPMVVTRVTSVNVGAPSPTLSRAPSGDQQIVPFLGGGAQDPRLSLPLPRLHAHSPRSGGFLGCRGGGRARSRSAFSEVGLVPEPSEVATAASTGGEGLPFRGAQARPCQEPEVLLAPGTQRAPPCWPASRVQGQPASGLPDESAASRHRPRFHRPRPDTRPSQRSRDPPRAGPQGPVPAPGQLRGGPSSEGAWRDRTRRTGQSGVSRGGRRGLGSSAGTRSLGTQAKSRGGDGQGSGFCRRSQCPVRVGSPGGSPFLFWGLGQGGAHTSYGQTYVSSKRS